MNHCIVVIVMLHHILSDLPLFDVHRALPSKSMRPCDISKLVESFGTPGVGITTKGTPSSILFLKTTREMVLIMEWVVYWYYLNHSGSCEQDVTAARVRLYENARVGAFAVECNSLAKAKQDTSLHRIKVTHRGGDKLIICECKNFCYYSTCAHKLVVMHLDGELRCVRSS